MDDIASDLIALGLTRNESLGYLCLLQAEEALGLTGYEVAARSGIPRSAVYGVLRKLHESGAIFPTGDKPARYAPVPPKDLLASMRRGTNARLDALEAKLDALPSRSHPEPVWIVSQYDEVLARLAEMIRGAERSVYLSVWQRELDALRPALADVGNRSLHRVLHSIDRITVAPSGFSCWVDTVEGGDPRGTWSHKVVAIVDGREALMGGTEPGADNQAVWTRNPSLVDLATNHIVLDITLIARRAGTDPTDAVAPMMRPHLDAVGS